ncbi:MAG: poly-gamma-glutamate capsule biosynthesis protein CapA/YwtB (metallophosphatase superfamily) [Myxococcota bacterium]|jgi:poly-gamma-glutamate capsule biosynthesis protein CapA/YwtB (metallophosphatase superfamily)
MKRITQIARGAALAIALLIAPQVQAGTSILFGGDTHFGENYNNDDVLTIEGYQYTIENFTSFLQQADAVVVNLETPITDLEESPLTGKSYLHWADPVLTPFHLLANNISVASLANNHTLDFGVPGLDQTFSVMQAEGFEWFGAGSDVTEAKAPWTQTFQVGNRSFTLVVIGAFEYRASYDADYNWFASDTNPGAYTLSARDIGAQVAAIKDVTPDVFVVAFPHWGSNYAWKTSDQTEMGHELINSGVDMVIGHGAHMLQEVELYQDRWIVYSLGNLVFNSLGRYASENAPPHSLILEMDLEDNGQAVEANFRLFPTFTDNRITGFQSRFVTPAEFDYVESLLLTRGGTGSWDSLYSEGQDADGNPYLELPLLDGHTRTVLQYDNFEPETLGNYTLGSTSDADLKSAGHQHCVAGSCIRLQDDNGIESSFFTTNGFDASGYDRLEIDYWMKSRFGETGDEYYVKYFDGTTWHTVATFVLGVDFVHDDIQNRVVVVDGSQYTMSSEAKILFEAAGGDNTDDLYFDQVRVSGVAEMAPASVPGLSAWTMMGLVASLGFFGVSTTRRRSMSHLSG